MTDDIAIRPATDADGPAVAALVAEVFAEYPGCLFVDAEFPELAAVASHYGGKGGTLWVAEQHSRIAGSFGIMRSPAPASFELAKVYLTPALRGRGLAGALLDQAFNFARERGGRRMELFTDTRFLDGHRFYERRGFVRLPGERFLADLSDTWEFHYERAL